MDNEKALQVQEYINDCQRIMDEIRKLMYVSNYAIVCGLDGYSEHRALLNGAEECLKQLYDKFEF